MNINLKGILKYRAPIFMGLCIVFFTSFTLSYALSSISLYAFIPYFFLDTKLNIKRKLKFIKQDKACLYFSLFFLVQCVGYFYSTDKAFALRRISVMLPLLFLPAILFSEQTTTKNLKKVLNISKYLILLIFLYYILIHVFVDNRVLNTFVHFTIGNKLGISQFYLTFIVLVPTLITAKAIFNRKQIVINSILLAFSFFILLLLGNKTILFFIVALIVALIIVFVTRKKYKMVLVLLMSIGIGATMISQTPIVKNRVAVFVKTLDLDFKTIVTKNKFTITKNTLEHRLLINYLSVKESVKAFPFGVGTGDTQAVLNTQYQLINFKAGIKGKLNNHNQYLEEFLKTGILGGVIFIVLLMQLILKINKKQFYYPIFLLYFIIACFFESYLVRQHGVAIFAFLIPFFYILEKLKTNK